MQTKVLKQIVVLFVLLNAVFSFSCKEDDDNDTLPVYTDRQVNNWIYSQMKIYYLWNERLPSSPNYNQRPDPFFESICYWYDEQTNPDGDRFSFIHSNYEELTNEMSGVLSNEPGFEFFLYLVEEGSDQVIGEIQYVKKGTPAEQKGLKRGHIFSAVNGQTITTGNYRDLLTLSGTYTLTLHEFYLDGDNIRLGEGYTVSLSTVASYAENPLFLDSVYVEGDRTIGYLAYHFFSDDSNDDSQRFNLEMIDVFERFSAANVTDLVIDLRYNLGGTLSSAECMAAMLVKDRSTLKTFLSVEYNDLITSSMTAEDKEESILHFIDRIKLKNGSEVHLPSLGNLSGQLIFLVGRRTASASEMVINGLKPYNEVNLSLVGDRTVGKNVGSITLYDKENYDKNKWAIQPIVVRFANSRGEADFTAGFVPNIVNDDDANFPKLPLGDRNEPLLRDAIGVITGKRSFRSGSTPTLRVNLIDSSLDRKAWSYRTEMKRQ